MDPAAFYPTRSPEEPRVQGSKFGSLPSVPPDDIMATKALFLADPRPEVRSCHVPLGEGKVNRSVGEAHDESGEAPTLPSVRMAEEVVRGKLRPKGYQALAGLEAYNSAMQNLVFGEDHAVLRAGQVSTVRTNGGTNAIFIGAKLLHMLNPEAAVALPFPTWGNHNGILREAGFRQIELLPYYNAETKSVDFARYVESLTALPEKCVVVLHSCCHNPTGADIDRNGWKILADLFANRRPDLVPFFDTAYQGFASGLEADAEPIRLFAREGLEFVVGQSGSKVFSAYNMRVGALHVVTADPQARANAHSVVTAGLVRRIQSGPELPNAMIIAELLGDPELRRGHSEDLARLRTRIIGNRQALVDGLNELGTPQNLDWILEHKGMFSLIPFSQNQWTELRNLGLFMVLDSEMTEQQGHPYGRMCFSLATSKDRDYDVRCLDRVLRLKDDSSSLKLAV